MRLVRRRREARHEDDAAFRRSRFMKAAAILLAVFLAVPGIDAVSRCLFSRQAPETMGSGIDSLSLMSAGNAEAVLGRIEELAMAGAADVPDVFTDEVGLLPGAHDVRVNCDGSIVGYVVSQNCSDALDLIAEQMETGGWTAVSLSGIEGATFIKSEGACRWALVVCTQVGSSTSVVVRSMIA